MITKNKVWYTVLLVLTGFTSCKSHSNGEQLTETVDSVEIGIENAVNHIISIKDSLVEVPSLRYAKGETETYTAKMYGKDQITKWIREEHISNEHIVGRDFYYENGQLIFIKEEGSVFNNGEEEYSEKLIYFEDDNLYKAYEKNLFTEDDMFEDSLYEEIELDLTQYDLEKPDRALKQQGEFTMYFDEFLFLDPQSYLIIENKDQSINAAIYIIQGDSLLNVLYENPATYEGKKIWVYHSFKEMSGVERMIYEGSVLLNE